MQMTWTFNTSNIGSSKTFFESLVKIRYDDVMWRHVTFFQDFFYLKMAEIVLMSSKMVADRATKHIVL